MADLLSALVEDAASREREIVASVEDWRLSHPERLCILGKRHLTDVTAGTRRAVRVIPVEHGPIMVEELARPWLRRVHAEGAPSSGMGRGRVPWTRDAERFLELLPPKWWGGKAREGEWAYVDIRRAYPSLYGPLTLDMRFRPSDETPRLWWGGMEFAGLSDLWHLRDLHLACGGIFRATRVRYIQDGAVRDEPAPWNRFLAPDLWGVMMMSLHAVADEAVRSHGCVQWNVDGGVFPRERAAGYIEWLADAWRLDARVKDDCQGKGTIYGLGHYQIGAHSTEIVETRNSVATRYILAIPPAVKRCLSAVRLHRLG